MIDSTEIDETARQHGVARPQILRDHLISHLLAALARAPTDPQVTFFGGTALCRTWLPDLRLSEDVDLLVTSLEATTPLRSHLSHALRREFPDLGWDVVGSKHAVATYALTTGDIDLKMQFAEWRHGWEVAIATTPAEVLLRYSDLPRSAQLTVPTPAGFAAMKLLAWQDRAAPRDIYDLAALADANMIDAEALDAVRKIAGFTPTSRTMANVALNRVNDEWDSELAHQLRQPRSLDDCLSVVGDALDTLSR